MTSFAESFVRKALNYSSGVSAPLSVTLTFAQSIDAKIAARDEAGLPRQLILSGRESMAMTHHLRLQHDCILVGQGTLLTDDPRLTAREEILGRSISTHEHQPQPVVVDVDLRAPVTCKLVTAGRLWIVTRAQTDDKAWLERLNTLKSHNVNILSIESTNRHLDIVAILAAIHKQSNHRFRNIMVEGGAGMIRSFAASGLIDRWIITVAPKLIGPSGIDMWGSHGVNFTPSHLSLSDSIQLGNDQIYLLT